MWMQLYKHLQQVINDCLTSLDYADCIERSFQEQITNSQDALVAAWLLARAEALGNGCSVLPVHCSCLPLGSESASECIGLALGSSQCIWMLCSKNPAPHIQSLLLQSSRLDIM